MCCSCGIAIVSRSSHAGGTSNRPYRDGEGSDRKVGGEPVPLLFLDFLSLPLGEHGWLADGARDSVRARQGGACRIELGLPRWMGWNGNGGGSQRQPNPDDFRVGMSGSRRVSRLDGPQEKQTMVKGDCAAHVQLTKARYSRGNERIMDASVCRNANLTRCTSPPVAPVLSRFQPVQCTSQHCPALPSRPNLETCCCCLLLAALEIE